jgi:hypothetical protein
MLNPLSNNVFTDSLRVGPKPRLPPHPGASAPDHAAPEVVFFPTLAVECKMFRSAPESISVRGQAGRD